MTQFKKSATERKKILLIEDDADLVEMLTDAILDEWGEGYTVTHVSSGLDASEKFNFQKYDLIITDLRLPEMNGAEVIRDLQSREVKKCAQAMLKETRTYNSCPSRWKKMFTPVLIITSLPKPEVELMLGTLDRLPPVLLKPLSQKSFVKEVDELVSAMVA